jgi:hypothetical protein
MQVGVNIAARLLAANVTPKIQIAGYRRGIRVTGKQSK